MKRSTKLALISVAGVAAVLAYSQYSSDAEAETDGTIFASVADCVSAGQEESSCKARFGEAFETYTKSAPRFVSREDCEKDFGAERCVPDVTAANTAQPATAQASSGGGYFMPMMLGFMAGRMLSGSQMGAGAAPLYGCAGGMSGANASCYSSNSGRRYSTSGGSFSGAARTVRTSVSEFRSAPNRSAFNVVPRGSSFRASTVSSRGGFGSTGRGFSSGSGS